MPILATTGLGRGLAGILQRARIERDDDDDSRGLGSLRGRIRARLDAEAARDTTAAAPSSREDLLVRTQQGEDVAQVLVVAEDAGSGRAAPAQPAIGGVGAVRDEADDVDRVGDLRSLQQQPPVFQSRRTTVTTPVSASPTAGLGAGLQVAANFAAAPATVAASTAGRPTDLIADLGNELVPSLDQEVDAAIRLLQADSAAAAAAPNPDAEAALAPETPVAAPAAPAPFPLAEEISRANTTPEIQQNLQANAGEIGQGLQVEAAAQAAANARRAAQGAEAAQENQAAEQVQEGQADLQELRAEVRELDRERAEAQRDVQEVENEVRQAQSGGAPSTAALAAQIGVLAQ